MPDPRPLVVNLEPGRHAICRCGGTGTPPFCDGSHAGTGVRPDILEVVDIALNVAWCRCRASGKIPYCDGSHRQFWDDPSKPPRK
jgi:CDGSH-type Zn-finger protein